MRRALLLAAAALAIASCGLPTASSPERIAPANVPYGLLASPKAAPATPGEGPATTVFLVNGDRLVPARRRVTGLNVPAEALRALLEGPTATESTAGVVSDIPSQTRLISLDLNGAVAAVDLSEDFGTTGGSQQVLAVAQIVYTLTASKYIDAVVFSLAGKPVEVPDGSGSLSTAPRSRADYKKVAPPGS
jgi:spore germination protein GerM